MKRRVAVGWMAFTAGAAFLPTIAPRLAPPAAAQDESSEVGAGPPGDASLRFVGRGAFGPDSVRLYGYLSGVIGLGGGSLFAAGDPTEATAAFTWTAELPAVARDARGDVTTFTGDGDLVIHHDPAGGASWSAPESFARGDALAAYALTLATSVQRQSPTLGVVVGDGTLAQRQAEPFSLGDEPFRFGHPGAALRLRFTGALAADAGSGGQPWPVGFTGTAVVLLPEIGSIAASEATPTDAVTASVNGVCDGWAGATRDRLRAAGAHAAAARAAPAGGLDASGLEAAAADIESSLAAQRAEPVGDADAAANRLAAAALGTYARGVRALIAGGASGDEATASAARQTLADGDGLADRARTDIAARYPDCA